MWTMPVVVMEPRRESQGALPGIVVSPSISPLPQSGLNESFCFAIGTRSERSSEEVADVVVLAEAAEELGFIARAVVGEEAANANAETGEEGKGSMQKSSSGGAFLVGVDSRKSQAGMIINGDMNILPAPALGWMTAITMQAMTDVAETSQFLDVEVEQVSRQGIFIALDRGRGLKQSQTVQSQATQDATDGSGTEAGGHSNAAASPALVSELDYALDQGGGCGFIQAMRTRTAIAQARSSFATKAPHPLGRGFGTDIERGCSRVQCQFLDHNFFDKCLSTPKRESGILVKVHSSLPEQADWFAPSASPV